MKMDQMKANTPFCLALSYDDDFVCSKHPKPNCWLISWTRCQPAELIIISADIMMDENGWLIDQLVCIMAGEVKEKKKN